MLVKNASIKSNKGIINFTELNIGNHVTLVGDAIKNNSFSASLILVCQDDNSQK